MRGGERGNRSGPRRRPGRLLEPPSLSRMRRAGVGQSFVARSACSRAPSARRRRRAPRGRRRAATAAPSPPPRATRRNRAVETFELLVGCGGERRDGGAQPRLRDEADVIGVPGMRAPFGLGRAAASAARPPPPLPGVPGPTPARRGRPSGSPRRSTARRGRRRAGGRGGGGRRGGALGQHAAYAASAATKRSRSVRRAGRRSRVHLPQRRQAERGAQQLSAAATSATGRRRGARPAGRRAVEAVEQAGGSGQDSGGGAPSPRRHHNWEVRAAEVGSEEVDGRAKAEHRHHLRLPRRHLGVEQQEERPPELLRELAQLVAVGARLGGAGGLGEELVVGLRHLACIA